MRKKLTAVVLAVLVFSLIAATAASLGPIDASDVGVGNGDIAACHPDTAADDLVIDFTTAWQGGEFRITGADLTLPDGRCDTQDVSLRVLDGTGAVVGPVGSGTFAGTAANVTLNADAQAAESVDVVISG